MKKFIFSFEKICIMDDPDTNNLFSWLKIRTIELRQLIDIEMQQKKVIVPKINQLNEVLFLYRYEDLLLKNLEQLILLKIYINSEQKIENYDFFSYVSGILTSTKDSMSSIQLDIYPRQFNTYLNYLNLVIQQLNTYMKNIEQIMQEKYDLFLNDIKNHSNEQKIQYTLTNIAEKFSIKCSGHLERISLLKAYEQDWKICKTCHAFICPTCGNNLNVCPNLARNKHNLELIGLPLENIINFLESDIQKSKQDDSFIIMDKIEKT